MIQLPGGKLEEERDTQQMLEWAIARWEAIQKEYASTNGTSDDLLGRIYKLLQNVTLLATEEEGIEFPTLFSRLAYMKSRYELNGQLLFALQTFRKQVEQKGSKYNMTELLQLGLWGTAYLIEGLWGQLPKLSEADIRHAGKLLREKRSYESYVPLFRGVILGPGAEEETLLFLSADDSSKEYVVAWNVAERNEIFTHNIKKLLEVGLFPYPCNLWHVEIDEKQRLFPQAFIFEPDYLVNVTAIASCFQSNGVQLLPYFLNKFLPRESSAPLLKGHIANHFFDGLLKDPQLDFLPLLNETFHMYPLEYALLDEGTMRKVYNDVKQFYAVIQSVIQQQFPALEMNASQAIIEPSFYHPELGLQGRLDMLQLSGPGHADRIIELKSGSAFKPNRYGLQSSHYVQTLLYDLMISHALPKDPRALSYILYCKDPDRPLRSAPVAREQQVEALQLRNRIVLWEQMLTRLTGEAEDLQVFNYLHPRQHDVAGFTGRDLHRFSSVFQALSEAEQSYFTAFTGFLAREHFLAKVGRDQSDRNYGLAAIWRESLEQKKDRFGVLNALKWKAQRRDKEHELIFERSPETDPLANFRLGDIAVLYPQKKGETPTQGQIYKCSIVDLTADEVVVRLRNYQQDIRPFQSGSLWNIEHDMLDSGFYKSFQNLFLWASAPDAQRKLYLGLRPPKRSAPSDKEEIERPKVMTDEQFRILKKMIQSKEYFLLWGPPGTGKTSVMLKYYVYHLFMNTDERLLLLAYTNRAVDEICHTLEEIGRDNSVPYARIGSSFGVAPEYRSRLLQKQVQNIDSRAELRTFLSTQRIFTATVSSFLGKRHLLKLIDFDRVVIDEASQLLEPMMGSIIHDFKRIVMIGDHRQLPAVVQQSPVMTRVRSSSLKKMGFRDLSDSLFERLFRKVKENKWDHAFDQLSYQGRMHPDIMKFPSKTFYEGQLRPLPFLKKESRSSASLAIPSELKTLALNRMMFWSSSVREEELLTKTNQDEARKVVHMIKSYQRLWAALGLAWDETSLGVITPFRAQIAQIQKEIWASDIEGAEYINVDTVERYQGSARDIIVMSLCINREDQWGAVSSPNTEGVDRKLNVALTRARKHFVLIGNKRLIQEQVLYRELSKQLVSFTTDE